MTQIFVGDSPLTLINTFTVDPAKADALIDLLNNATEAVMRHRQGFISANIHKSLDGRHVLNYAQWRSRADFEAMQQDPAAREHMGKAARLSEGFDPVVYTVAAVHEASPPAA